MSWSSIRTRDDRLNHCRHSVACDIGHCLAQAFDLGQNEERDILRAHVSASPRASDVVLRHLDGERPIVFNQLVRGTRNYLGINRQGSPPTVRRQPQFIERRHAGNLKCNRLLTTTRKYWLAWWSG